MSAAARATSVAPSTEMPTSAARMAGASFTPSPMKPTMCPRACKARMILVFWSGVTRAKRSTSATRPIRAGSVSAAISLPGEHALGGLVLGPRHARTHGFMIARNDLDPDMVPSRATAFAALALGGSTKTQKPNQYQIVLVVRARSRAILWHRLPGNGQQPVAARRLLVLQALDLGAHARIKGSARPLPELDMVARANTCFGKRL